MNQLTAAFEMIEEVIVESIQQNDYEIVESDEFTITLDIEDNKFVFWMCNGEDNCSLYSGGVKTPLAEEYSALIHRWLHKEWQQQIAQKTIETKRKELAALEAKFNKGE